MPRELPPDIDPAGGAGGGAPINPKPRLTWIVKGTMSRADLEAVSGVAVNAWVTGYASCRFRTETLPAVLALSGVTNVRYAPPVDYAMDEAADLIYASALWGGRKPPRTGITGKGVIVAIIDTGLDVFHNDFRKTPGGETRVLDAWDQTISGTPPTGFSYGDRIDNADVTNMINGGFPTALIDSSGHGTMVAGIACGNGSAPNGLPITTPVAQDSYLYVGIAPEAEIVVVKLPDQPTIANVVDAVAFAFKVATDTGRAVVCNLSLCSREGQHVGFSDLDKMLAGLVAAEEAAGRLGRHIVAAAGNEGNTYRHLHTDQPNTGSPLEYNSCSIASHASAGIQESLWVQGWTDATSEFEITIDTNTPSSHTFTPVPFGTEATETFSGVTVTVRNAVDAAVNGKRKIDVFIRTDNATVLQSLGFKSVRTGGASTAGTIDWYMVQSITNGKRDAFTWPNITPIPQKMINSGITSPGSCAAALCVGAESANSHFFDSSGVAEVPGNGIVGAYQPFSSQGPLLGTATIKPDLVAPATAFVTSLSASRSPAVPYYQVDADMKHAQVVQGSTLRDGGTSIAAAFAAGAAALVVQRAGKQSNAQLLSFFKSQLLASRIAANDTAAQDPLPNNKLGNGKLWLQIMTSNVGVGPDPIIPLPGGTGGGSPGDVVGSDPPIKRVGDPSDYPPKYLDPQTGEVHNIVEGDPLLTSFVFDLPYAPYYNPREALSLRVVDYAGAEVYRASGSIATRESVLAWPGITQAGAAVAPGVYFATIVAGDKMVTRTVFI